MTIADPSPYALPIAHGGPFFRFERRFHLEDPRRIGRLIVLLWLVAWLPIVVLGIYDLVLGRSSPTVALYGVHVRALVIPLLLLAEQTLDRIVSPFASRLVLAGVVPDAHAPALERRVRFARAARDSSLPELAIAAIITVLTIYGVRGALPDEALRWLAPSLHGSVAAAHSSAWWWFVIVTQPLYLFLLIRFLFHWLLWALVLVRLARLPLNLQVNHPDGAGGLAFLAEALLPFRFVILAIGAALSASWANEMIATGSTAAPFAVHFLRYVALAVAIGVAPYLAFTPRLVDTKLVGAPPYWHLARGYVARFDQKWLKGDGGPDALGSADIQSLADLGGAYQAIVEMRTTPFTQRQLKQLVLIAILPVIPIILLAVPAAQLARMLLRL